MEKIKTASNEDLLKLCRDCRNNFNYAAGKLYREISKDIIQCVEDELYDRGLDTPFEKIAWGNIGNTPG
jgi:hypothetical protein